MTGTCPRCDSIRAYLDFRRQMEAVQRAEPAPPEVFEVFDQLKAAAIRAGEEIAEDQP